MMKAAFIFILMTFWGALKHATESLEPLSLPSPTTEKSDSYFPSEDLNEFLKQSIEWRNYSFRTTNNSGIGEKLYKNYCTICHGTNGKLGIGGATDLTSSTMNLKERTKIIKEGKGMMAPFDKILTDKEIKAVSKYSMTLK